MGVKIIFATALVDSGLPGSRLRISMDRISDSDSEDAGSIPAGATRPERRKTFADFPVLFFSKPLLDFLSIEAG
jgi:hypothetical protein